MRRYIWLGDSKYGGSVFWDKKRDVAVRDGSIKVSAKKSKLKHVSNCRNICLSYYS